MDDYLRRRYAFWDNFTRDLSYMLQDVGAKSAGRFVDDADMITIRGIQAFLKNASLLALKRYHAVLGEYIESSEVPHE